MHGLRKMLASDGQIYELRMMLLWGSTALLALALMPVAPLVAVAGVAASVLLVLTMHGVATGPRLAVAAAHAPAFVAADAPPAAWVVAGMLVGAAMALGRAQESGETQLLRHLERARRRGESASVMVLRVPAARSGTVRGLQERLRAADSSRINRSVGVDEIHAVMDGEDLPAAAIEMRLRADEIDGATFGWSRFPRDGGSLDVLLETARARARGETLPADASAERAAAPFSPSLAKAD
jgi:hypothetical protein